MAQQFLNRADGASLEQVRGERVPNVFDSSALRFLLL
jgi:hypothetical protein